MRLLVLLFALSQQYVIVQAQKSLSKGPQHGPLTKIYKISDTEAKKLTHRNLYGFNEHYLHTLVDSFPTLEEVPSLPAGNYLLVFADRNRLKYRLYTAGDVDADF